MQVGVGNIINTTCSRDKGFRASGVYRLLNIKINNRPGLHEICIVLMDSHLSLSHHSRKDFTERLSNLVASLFRDNGKIAATQKSSCIDTEDDGPYGELLEDFHNYLNPSKPMLRRWQICLDTWMHLRKIRVFPDRFFGRLLNGFTSHFNKRKGNSMDNIPQARFRRCMHVRNFVEIIFEGSSASLFSRPLFAAGYRRSFPRLQQLCRWSLTMSFPPFCYWVRLM